MFGIDISETKWSQLKNVTDWGITEELVKIRLNRALKIDELQLLKKLFVKNLELELAKDKAQFNEISGAVNFFNNLTDNSKYQIGIATGGWEESANLKLRTIGIKPFDICYSNSNYFKSRIEITQNVIEQMDSISNTSPTEIIYFGDGEWDYITCLKLGIRFIGIDNKRNAKLKGIGAKEVYKNFEESETIMTSIENRSS